MRRRSARLRLAAISAVLTLSCSGCFVPVPIPESALLTGCVSVGDGVTIKADGLSSEQLANARLIAGFVESKGLPSWVATFSLAVGLHESDLINLPGGDGSSVGIFQQTDIYGSKQQRMDVQWATSMFVLGGIGANGGSIGGLVNQTGWQTYADGNNWDKLAIQIQRPSIAAYYSTTHNILNAIAQAKAFVISASTSTITNSNSCESASGAVVGDGSFNDDRATTYPGVDLMLEKASAIVDPTSQVFRNGCPAADHCYRDCDRIAAYVWGYSSAGYATAYIHWQAMLASGKAHAGSRNVPVGALLFFGTSTSAGHVAVYLGGSKALSNDIWDNKTGRTGGMYIVPAGDFEKLWNARYLGWSSPTFAGERL